MVDANKKVVVLGGTGGLKWRECPTQAFCKKRPLVAFTSIRFYRSLEKGIGPRIYPTVLLHLSSNEKKLACAHEVIIMWGKISKYYLSLFEVSKVDVFQ